jgi:putative ABC transport system ATP-binding protein
MALLEIKGLQKEFRSPDGQAHRVVDVPSFELGAAQAMALAGPSGSGKTTFLHLIAGILTADAGSIRIDGVDMATLPEHARDRLRARSIGYIFQTFNLLQGFTCLENVLLGMSFGAGVDRSRAMALLDRVGLSGKLHHHPRQLSTGQQQRVAVARALAGKPRLVLADEPTGNLDTSNAREALALIREVCAENGSALLLVSHDRDILAAFDHVASLADLNRAAHPSTPSPLRA